MKKSKIFSAVISAMLLTAFVQCGALAEDGEVKTITVLPYQRQTITGWGCYPSNYYGGTMNRSKTSNTDTSVITRKAAMSTLFNDMGVTVLRHEIVSECGNGDASLNTDWMDKTVAAIKAGLDAGIKEYMITSWAPPYEMMTGQSGAYRFNPDYEDKFSEFIVNAFDYITAHGCPPPTVYSFQNEPQTGRNWCRITLGQYQRIAKKMRKALDAGGYENVRLLSPECAAYYQHAVIMGTDYSSLYEDPEFADAVGVLGTHSYCFVSTGESKDTDVYKFAMNASNFPEKDRWETEFSGGRVGFEELDDISMNLGTAMFSTEVMLGDVIWGGMNCWMYWNGYDSRQFTYPDSTTRFMRTGKLGSHQSLLYGNGFEEIKKNAVGVAFSTIWKNVPVGSKVHWAWTDDDALFNSMGLRGDIGAFERPDGTSTLVVINKHDTPKEYNINGLGGVSARVYTMTPETDQEPYLTYRNVVNGSIKNYVCDPYTITVIVTDKEDISPTNISIVPNSVSDYTNGVYTTPEETAVISGYVDEPVLSFTINTKAVKVNDDLSFSYTVNTREEKSLDIRCVDAISKKASQKTVDLNYKEGFINLKIDKAPQVVTANDYTFSIETGVKADMYVNGNKVNAEQQDRFEVPVNLSEGENSLTFTAVTGTDKKEITLNVFCDSIKPQITFDNKSQTTNDWEYLVTGKVSEPLSSLIIGGNRVEVKEDLSFSAKVSLDEGDNEIKAEAEDIYGNVTDTTLSVTYTRDGNTPHFVNGKMYVRKAEKNITIDGSLNEADWKTDIKICKQVTGAYPSNNICNVGFLWDENYFYIGAKVEDTEYHCDTQYAYNNDSIEFLFNPSARREGPFEPEDKQLFSGPINGNYQTYYQNKKAPGIIQKYNIHEGGYEAEIAVPWTEIEKAPSLGAVFAFELACNDDDTSDTSRTSIMTWSTENTDYYSITSDYGLAELVANDYFNYEDAVYASQESAATGDENIVIDGVTYTELGAVCEKYGSIYYDNPNTGLVNIFTSTTRKIDITEGAYQTFVDKSIAKWKNPVIKQESIYYIDAECEQAIFKGIEPFNKYGN